tara:strand:- start:837 stop:1013 length:177 start_codon:yes stop_codon:yes gene_type:complete
MSLLWYERIQGFGSGTVSLGCLLEFKIFLNHSSCLTAKALESTLSSYALAFIEAYPLA